MITPHKKNILVVQDPKETEEMHSGILVNSTYTKRTDMHVHLAWGTIVSVGAECDAELAPGMRVCFNPFDAYEIEDEDYTTYMLVSLAGLRAASLSTPT